MILGSTLEISASRSPIRERGTPTMRSPGPDEPSGRGLQIVDMLSESWGVVPEQPSRKDRLVHRARHDGGALRL